MKKLLTIIGILFMCSMSFARVMVQENLSGLGVGISVNHQWENLPEDNRKDIEFYPYGGLSTSVLWEFNSDIKVAFHPYVGADFGFFMFGLFFAPEVGFNYRLMQLKKIDLELSASAAVGPLIDVFGGIHFYTSQSLDLIVCSRSRRWFYGGLGITNQLIPQLNIYPGYGYDLWKEQVIGLRLIAGLRI